MLAEQYASAKTRDFGVIRILTALWLLSVPAFGGTLLPPAPYDHPYTGQVTVMNVLASAIPAICQTPNAEACVILNAKGLPPIKVLPKVGPGGVSQRQHDILDRHEDGHLNGWGKDHAGGY